MEAVRAGADARTRLELALVKAARPEPDSSSRALRARIERLERRDPPSEAPSQGPREPELSAAGHEQEPAPPVADGAPATETGPAPRPPRSTQTGAPAETGATAQPGASPDTGATPQTGAPSQTGAPAETGVGGETGAAPAPVQERARGAEGREVARPLSAEAQGDALESLRAAWPAVVELVREQNALLGALIEEAEPVAVAGAEVTVAFPAGAPFLKKKAEDPAHRRAVGDALCSVLAGRWTLSYALGDESAGTRARRPDASEEDWIKRLMEEFDAEEVPSAQPAAPAEDAVAARGGGAGGGREAG
jgi:DNA polymerase III subunit gamma/tau